jgi:hypothetical protein
MRLSTWANDFFVPKKSTSELLAQGAELGMGEILPALIGDAFDKGEGHTSLVVPLFEKGFDVR